VPLIEGEDREPGFGSHLRLLIPVKSINAIMAKFVAESEDVRNWQN
jgi:hypothetical protein